jgi:hypothetical protein
MSLPRMDSDPTAHDRDTALQPLTAGSTVGEASAHLRATGERAAVVVRHGLPVGIVSGSPVADAVRAGATRRSWRSWTTPRCRSRVAWRPAKCSARSTAWEWLRAASPATYSNRRDRVTG